MTREALRRDHGTTLLSSSTKGQGRRASVCEEGEPSASTATGSNGESRGALSTQSLRVRAKILAVQQGERCPQAFVQPGRWEPWGETTSQAKGVLNKRNKAQGYPVSWGWAGKALCPPSPLASLVHVHRPGHSALKPTSLPGVAGIRQVLREFCPLPLCGSTGCGSPVSS